MLELLPALRATLVAVAVAAPLTSFTRPAAPAAKPNVVTVTATDYAFDAPASVPAGLTTLRIVNNGKELHHVAMIRVDSGKTMDDVMAAIKAGGPPPAWAHEVPGPNAPAPGMEANTTVVLEPGTYALLCFIPSPDHTPHVMKGMSRMITVTPTYGAKAAKLPAADLTMTFVDYGFNLSKPLTAGTRTIRVRNTAAQPHEVELVRLQPGKTAMDVITWIDAPNGPPPGMPIGGVVGVAPGTEANFSAKLETGEYALICFVPDAKDGKPHFMHGMTRQITVK